MFKLSMLICLLRLILSKDFVFHIMNEFKLMSNLLKTFKMLKLKAFYIKEKLTLCVAFKTSNLKADLLKLFQYNPLKRTSVLHLKDFYKLVSLNSMWQKHTRSQIFLRKTFKKELMFEMVIHLDFENTRRWFSRFALNIFKRMFYNYLLR